MKPIPLRVTLSLLSLTVGVYLLGLWGSAARIALPSEPSVTATVRTPKVPLGGTAVLTVDAPGASAVRVKNGELTIAAHRRSDGRWNALVGIWADEAPGAHLVTVEADVDGRTVTGDATFTVTDRTFPVQHLRMSAAQDDMYEAPSVQEEYRLIRAALASETERVWDGKFQLPVKGRLSTRYGVQRYRNGNKVGIHKGIDLAARKGTLIYAANAGTVVLRRDFGLHGRTVVIDHGAGVVGLYLHLSEFGVSEGQHVAAGQKIGRVGATGVATGPHLHYALYVHGVAVDPLLAPDSAFLNPGS